MTTLKGILRELHSFNHVLIILMGLLKCVEQMRTEENESYPFDAFIGYHVIMAEGMMLHYTSNPITRGFSYTTRSRLHGLVQLLATYFILSCHSISFIGAFAKILCLINVTLGISNYFEMDLSSRKTIKVYHNLLGLATFGFGMASILASQKEGVPKLVTWIVLVLTTINPVKSLWHKLNKWH